MSKPSARATRRKSASRPKVARPTPDRTFYIGFIVIGAFVAFLSAVLTGGQYWMHAVLAYLVILLFFVHRSALAIHRGSHDLPGWQRALARLPLRVAGYGTKGGKPIEASHGDPRARNVIIVSAIVWVVLIGAAVAWLVM